MDRRGYEDLLGDLPHRRDQVLPALHLAHGVMGWLPESAIEAVSRHTFVPLSELYGIISGYSEFRLAPPHTPHIEVCTGLSCLIAGGDAVLATALDLSITVEPIACRFLCGVAPVAMVGGHYYGRLTGPRFSTLVARAEPMP